MDTKRLFAGIIIMIGITSSIYAQNTCLDSYDKEGIYLRTEFFRGTVFIKNGIKQPVGFVFHKLRPEFESAPRALPLFKKAQLNAKLSFGVGILGIALATTGAIIAVNSINGQGYLINEQRYNNGIALMVGSTAISSAISIPLQTRSRRQLDDAIWLRNRALLER